MKEITITLSLDDWRAVHRALKYRADRWYKESEFSDDNDRAALTLKIAHRYDRLADKVEDAISK